MAGPANRVGPCVLGRFAGGLTTAVGGHYFARSAGRAKTSDVQTLAAVGRAGLALASQTDELVGGGVAAGHDGVAIIDELAGRGHGTACSRTGGLTVAFLATKALIWKA